MRRIGMLAVVGTVALAGCSSGSEEQPIPPPPAKSTARVRQSAPIKPRPEPKPAPRAAAPPVPGAVSQSEYGENWPLTVTHGEVRCDGSDGMGEAIFVAPDGTEYGLNGLALDAGYGGIEPIWRYQPGLKKYDLRVSVGPLLNAALALCE